MSLNFTTHRRSNDAPSNDAYGRYFSPWGHNLVRFSFEQDGWICKKTDNGFHVQNDPLHLFVGIVGGEESALPVVVGRTQGRSTNGAGESGR